MCRGVAAGRRVGLSRRSRGQLRRDSQGLVRPSHAAHASLGEEAGFRMIPFALVAPSSLSLAGQPMTMLGLLAVLALVPFAIVMLTSFSKIVVVLSISRSALGTQQAPPTVVLTGLAAV